MLVTLYLSLLFLTLAPILYSRYLFKQFWNPIALVTIITLPIKLFIYVGPNLAGYVVDNGMLFAMFVETVYLATQLLVTLLIITSKQGHIFDKYLVKQKFLSNQKLRVCSLFFFTLFLITFVILAYSTIGLIDWLKDPRYAYINHRRGNGALYALSVNFLCISAFFAFICSEMTYTLFAKFIAYAGILALFGSKGGIVSLLICYVIVDSMLFGVKIKRLVAITPFAVAMVAFMIAQSGLSSLLKFLEYFDYFTNAAKYYADYLNGNFLLQEGKIFITGFWGMLPRSLFEEKPIIYGVLHIVEHYYPGGPASGNTPAFGARVQQFADFGFYGLLFFAILNPWNLFYSFALVALFKNKYQKFSFESVNNVFVFAILFAPQFGVFFSGINFVIITVVMFMLVKMGTKFTYRWS